MDEKINLNFLSEIGLTKGETKVYLALLKLGQVTTGIIAKDAQVSRSKIDGILTKLSQKGLVGHLIKGKIRYYTATEPKRILDYLKEKDKELKNQINLAEKIIPQLELKRKSQEQKTNATLYEGKKAIKNFYLSILDDLKSGEIYHVIGASYDENSPEIKDFFQNYHTQRAKKKIKLKMLANFNTKDKLVPATYKNSEIRFLPQYLVNDMIAVFYKNKTFIFFWIDEPKGFLIESKEIANSFKIYFDTFWRIAKK